MSYARFGSDGSDVYVFTSSRAIECCGCVMQKRRWVEEPAMKPFGGYFEAVPPIIETEFTSNQGMIDHLLAHRAAGHTVPESALERLRNPEDAAENEAIWAEEATKQGGRTPQRAKETA